MGFTHFTQLAVKEGFAIGKAGSETTIIDANGNVGGRVQELTVSGAVPEGIQSAELNHATAAIAATIADSLKHKGLFIAKDTSASGTAAHTLTLTAGTFDGTNDIATFNAPGECLVVYFDSSGNGIIVENVGLVGLSSS